MLYYSLFFCVTNIFDLILDICSHQTRSLGYKTPQCSFGVCGAQGTCLVAVNVVFSRWWSYQRLCAPTNSLAGFKGPLRGGKKKGKEKEERGQDEVKRRKGRENSLPPK